MSTALVQVATAMITRDAMTRIPTTVPAHEIEILKTVFGEDNVQVINEDAGSVELDPSIEGERLAGKYGDGTIVRVYGENYKGAAAKALSSHEISVKPKGRAAVPA